MAQFTTTEVAEKFGTTPRTLRKFLRADARANDAADALPGKGSRYAIEGKDLTKMKSRFKKWHDAEAKARAERIAEKAKQVAEVEETDADELDAEVDGPTDAEIEEIDAELDD